MGGQIDEVGDANRAVQIQIADAGQANLDVLIAMGIGDAGQADAGAGMGCLAGIINAVVGSQGTGGVGILNSRPEVVLAAARSEA